MIRLTRGLITKTLTNYRATVHNVCNFVAWLSQVFQRTVLSRNNGIGFIFEALCNYIICTVTLRQPEPRFGPVSGVIDNNLLFGSYICEGVSLVAVSHLGTGLYSSKLHIAWGHFVLQLVRENEVDRRDQCYVETESLVIIEFIIYNSFTFSCN